MKTRTSKERLTIWLLSALVLGAMVVVWGTSLGNPVDYLTHRLPAGQSLYVFSKLAGLIAFGLFWLQCLFALARGALILKALPPLSRATHMRLGAATLVTALLHFVLFFAAASLRQGEPAWSLLTPQFTEGYYSRYISLGLAGLLLLGLAAFAGWRVSRGRLAWRKVHATWLVVFGLVFWHAFAIGSESRYGVMRYVWLFMAASVGVSMLSWMGAAWRNVRAGRCRRLDAQVPSESDAYR